MINDAAATTRPLVGAAATSFDEVMCDWLLGAWRESLLVLLSLAVVYVAIIAYCRLVGVRSFAKMSAFDFAMTVAVGSLFGASIVSANPSLMVTMVALAGLFAGQWLIGLGRWRLHAFKRLVDNEPLLLVRNGKIVPENLKRAQITMDDLRAKLREANVLSWARVRAVVAETSGDISVLHTAKGDEDVDADLLYGVRGADRAAVARG